MVPFHFCWNSVPFHEPNLVSCYVHEAVQCPQESKWKDRMLLWQFSCGYVGVCVCVCQDDSEQTAILDSGKCHKDKDIMNVADNQEANDREPPLQRQQPFRQQLYSTFFVFWVAKQPGCN